MEKSEKRQFVKYQNRKLYDRSSGSYATMSELDELVGSGVAIEVVDDRTGDDHTVFTLARLVYDRCRADKDAFDRGELLKLLKKPSKASKAA